MTNFARCAIVLSALMVSTPALAQDWRVAAISGAKPARTVYLVDTAAIVRNGNNINFMTQSVFEAVTEARDFDRSVTRRAGDCSAFASQIVENTYYAKGALISNDKSQGSMIAHREGTVMWGVMQKACGIKQFEGTKIIDPESAVRTYFAKP